MKPSVLIIGAKSDIARAIAEKYAASGHNLVLAGRNKEAIDEIASDLSVRYNIQAGYAELDVTAYETHQPFFAGLDPFPLIVICAAGYLGDQKKAETDTKEASRIMETNYNGCVSVLSVAANYLEERGEGTIAGISSVAGDRGRETNYFYGSAKSGFTAFLSGLRSRLSKKGVHVVTVKPGFVDTSMTSEMKLPPLLTATSDKAAADICAAIKNKRNVIYTKWFWRYIMLIIRLIPESVFKKMKL